MWPPVEEERLMPWLRRPTPADAAMAAAGEVEGNDPPPPRPSGRGGRPRGSRAGGGGAPDGAEGTASLGTAAGTGACRRPRLAAMARPPGTALRSDKHSSGGRAARQLPGASAAPARSVPSSPHPPFPCHRPPSPSCPPTPALAWGWSRGSASLRLRPPGRHRCCDPSPTRARPRCGWPGAGPRPPHLPLRPLRPRRPPCLRPSRIAPGWRWCVCVCGGGGGGGVKKHDGTRMLRRPQCRHKLVGPSSLAIATRSHRPTGR
jgi:hypothetical protein